MLEPRRLAIAMLAAISPSVAHAHHALGGRVPATVMEGAVSGCAHPVLGADHLVFLIVGGLLAGALRLPLAAPAMFVATSLTGIAIHLARIDVPGADAAIAISVLMLGLAAMGLVGRQSRLWLALFTIAGLLHGYAYGETIVGAPASALIGYLGGIGVMQVALMAGAALIGQRLAARMDMPQQAWTGIGTLTAAIGVILLVTALPAPT